MTDTAQQTRGKILLMDDDDIVLEITGQMLESYGYVVVTAREGEDALQKYQHALAMAEPFDLVILDLTVRGGVGGLAVIKKILSLNPTAKVVVSTGYADDPALAKYQEYGFCAVMTKPYRLERLKKDLEQILG